VCEEIAVVTDKVEHPGSPPPAHNLQEAHQLQAEGGEPTHTIRSGYSRGVYHIRLRYTQCCLEIEIQSLLEFWKAFISSVMSLLHSANNSV